VEFMWDGWRAHAPENRRPAAQGSLSRRPRVAIGFLMSLEPTE
jgi:hypothetical protein